MASELLLEITNPQLLLSGVFKNAPPLGMPLWATHRNVALRDGVLRKSPGFSRISPSLNSFTSIKAFAQAQVGATSRLYFANGTDVYNWTSGAPVSIGTISGSAFPWLEPFGTWLAFTDNVNQPKLWKNGGAAVNIGTGEFTRAKILMRFSNFLLAISTDVLPSGFHWSNRSDPETWAPLLTNTAGNAPIREFDSDINAAAYLGSLVALYGTEKMALVNYVGGQFVMGARIALEGIGALGPYAVASVGRENFGMGRQGIWRTDGTGFAYIDRPAIGRLLELDLDLARGNEVIVYHNELLEQVQFYYPRIGGGQGAFGYDYKRNAFTELEIGLTAASERKVFSWPIEARSIGPTFAGAQALADAATIEARLTSKPLDGGNVQYLKSWQYMTVDGKIPPDVYYRIGWTDNQDTVAEFTEWTLLGQENPFPEYRESLFLVLDFKGVPGFEISGIKVYGELAGAAF